ncbi:MAG: Mu transposase C-terminal domain-containing protein [Nostoc sp. DedSLP03]|uniref:Mu transposase C-terminal domain-containing protein n=1 Tax=Nostoc sp. DedSLP03 TaxID=3075400 RepID=UPI002AD4E2E4|nr:Mu transposase C-terminal domain-containing protein [Nostoc sp. DedSLP03]MDZ7968043.1 Mu transposase C-terminal domain-containing protein [Nostoc sp. DedSLP03]
MQYFVAHYNFHYYPKTKQKRILKWESGFLLEEPELIDERELDICLMKVAYRNVEKHGSVNFLGWVYQGDCLLDYEGKQVSLRYDKRNITTVLAYTRPINSEPGEFIGIIQARDCERERMSLAELNYIKKKLRDKGKEIDNSSILNERLSRFEDVEQKRKETRKQRRKQAQQKQEVKTNKSKVVELFPENATPEEITTSQENLISTSNAVAQNTVNSIDKQVTQNKPDPNQTPKVRRRPRVGVKDWNQFMKDNW